MNRIHKSKKIDNSSLETQKQAQEYLEGWRRCKADFENFKKNQDDWMKRSKREALENIMSDLIPILINFNLALKHIPKSEENKPLIDGVVFIEKQLQEALFSHGLKLIETNKGDIFDPQIHESVEEVKGDGESSTEKTKKNFSLNKTVIIVEEVVNPGYRLEEKVLYPAKVKTRYRD